MIYLIAFGLLSRHSEAPEEQLGRQEFFSSGVIDLALLRRALFRRDSARQVMEGEAPSGPGLPGRSWNTHQPVPTARTERGFMNGSGFGDGVNARIFWVHLAAVVCGVHASSTDGREAPVRTASLYHSYRDALN
jgi:hypothetical protein